MPLTIGSVIDAGMLLASRAGLEGVGVRSVAAQLDVTPMALYRHVGNVEHLHRAVVDGLLTNLPAVSASGEWIERCRRWAFAARDVLTQTPGLARHVLLEWIHLRPVLVALDGLVATLEADGPDGIDAVAGANAILTHVLMRAQAEEAVSTHAVRRDLSTLRVIRAEAPRLWAHRDEYRTARLDEHFAYGLDALLHGLASSRRAP